MHESNIMTILPDVAGHKGSLRGAVGVGMRRGRHFAA